MTGHENQDRFGFVDAVRNSFAFLERDFGFRRVRETNELVRYEHGPFFVNVFNEIGVGASLGRRARMADGPVALWRQALKEWGVDFPVEYLPGSRDALDDARTMVQSREDVRRHVTDLADFLRANANGLLTGDDAAYRAMGELARRRSTELTRRASGKTRS